MLAVNLTRTVVEEGVALIKGEGCLGLFGTALNRLEPTNLLQQPFGAARVCHSGHLDLHSNGEGKPAAFFSGRPPMSFAVSRFQVLAC